MQEAQARALTVQAGRELLEKGLVARTWGNVSCRLDADTMVITPSGLDYTATTEADIVKYTLSTGEWEGLHKPSSEKGIHAAAFECFPEVSFVIHTHQNAASATSLAGFSSLIITPREREQLGGIALAAYGLPGTKTLWNAVRRCLETGAHTVLMARHGVLIAARDKDEAMERAALLETVCTRSLKCLPQHEIPDNTALLERIRQRYPHADIAATPNLLCQADTGRSIYAQLDDMAQMIGGLIPLVRSERTALRYLEYYNTVLMPGAGAIVNAEDADDTEALKLLADKAALCALHTRGCRAYSRLSPADVVLMRSVYRLKYSKQKGSKK